MRRDEEAYLRWRIGSLPVINPFLQTRQGRQVSLVEYSSISQDEFLQITISVVSIMHETVDVYTVSPA